MSYQPGARIYVLWTDGGTYPATVAAVSQGYVQARWDSGGLAVWVPFSNVRPQQGGPAMGFSAPPGPQVWANQGWSAPAGQAAPSGNAQAAPAGQAAPAANTQAAQPAAAVQPAAVQPAAASLPQQTPSKPELPPIPAGPPPRPMTGQIAGLPRGLVYEPMGQGTGSGKTFYFFSGFVTAADTDMAMRMTDIEHLGDDVAALRAAGYRVVFDLHGDLEGLNLALTHRHPDGTAQTAGVFWSGHGDDDGSLQDYKGDRFDASKLAPEAASIGALKLFVMSACYVGSAQGKWQKALGKQATVIGWGAPLSNTRAIDFLTPDADSSKDFDDLLARHLGVARIAQDGALTEVKTLAEQHEAKTAAMLLSFDELVEAVNARSKNLLDKKGKSALFLTLAPPSKDQPDKLRKQVVRAYAIGTSDTFIVVSSLIGPYSDALDLPRAIRMLDELSSVKLTLSKVGETEFVMLETLHRRRRLDPLTLSRSINVVGLFADRLEDLFFGSDQR